MAADSRIMKGRKEERMRKNYTREDIIQLVEDEDVEYRYLR